MNLPPIDLDDTITRVVIIVLILIVLIAFKTFFMRKRKDSFIKYGQRFGLFPKKETHMDEIVFFSSITRSSTPGSPGDKISPITYTGASNYLLEGYYRNYNVRFFNYYRSPRISHDILLINLHTDLPDFILRPKNLMDRMLPDGIRSETDPDFFNKFSLAADPQESLQQKQRIQALFTGELTKHLKENMQKNRVIEVKNNRFLYAIYRNSNIQRRLKPQELEGFLNEAISILDLIDKSSY